MKRRISWDAVIIIALLLAWVVWFLFVIDAITVDAGSGSDLPSTITVTAPVNGVNCAGPCCCGEVTVLYLGHYYTNPAYCKWFRPLREGQNVTTTVRLWR